MYVPKQVVLLPTKPFCNLNFQPLDWEIPEDLGMVSGMGRVRWGFQHGIILYSLPCTKQTFFSRGTDLCHLELNSGSSPSLICM